MRIIVADDNNVRVLLHLIICLFDLLLADIKKSNIVAY